jgi:hypothetical protein
MTAGIGGGHAWVSIKHEGPLQEFFCPRSWHCLVLLPIRIVSRKDAATRLADPVRTRMPHAQRARICRLMISEPALRPCKNPFSRAMDCPVLRNTRVPKDAEALLHANVLKARTRAPRAEIRSAHTGQLNSSARTVRMQILLYNRKLSARLRRFSSVNPPNGRNDLLVDRSMSSG